MDGDLIEMDGDTPEMDGDLIEMDGDTPDMNRDLIEMDDDELAAMAAPKPGLEELGPYCNDLAFDTEMVANTDEARARPRPYRRRL
jgi:hypothetical protein